METSKWCRSLGLSDKSDNGSFKINESYEKTFRL